MPQLTVEQALALAEHYRLNKQFQEAERVLRQILSISPANPFVLNRLGMSVGDAGRMKDAGALFRDAVEIDPNFAEGWANLSLACERLEDLDAAIAARRKVLELQPAAAESWHRLGVCLGKKNELADAIDALRKSIAIDPGAEVVYHDLVLALCKNRQFEQAEEVAFQRLPTTQKAKAETFRLLADNFKALGQFERATGVWRRVAQHDRFCYEAHGQLAMCLITLGEYEQGWALYESRWDCDTFSDNTRRDPRRQWGSTAVGNPDVNGKTLLIYSEQGIGDTIQFVRYADLLAQRGARVIVQCPWPIKSLLERCRGVRLVYASGEQLPAYDWHIPTMSLPHAFQTTLQTIPGAVPYIFVDPARRKSWDARLDAVDPDHKALRVGIAWAGNPRHKNDANRSLHPDLLEPLGEIPNVKYFSLQKANENEKAAIEPKAFKLVDFTALLHDFADTAAMIDLLEVVICADTAVAHLAGALGKKVWTLLPFVPDFRWGLGSETTPWYPTMRLFRQPAYTEWKPVIERLAQELKALRL